MYSKTYSGRALIGACAGWAFLSGVGCGGDTDSSNQGRDDAADSSRTEVQPGDGTNGPDLTDDAASHDDADAGDAGDADSGDAGQATAGTRCVAGDECASGWCVPSALGAICADLCVETCPEGARCLPAEGSGSDPVYLCVPIFVPPGGDVVDADTIEGDSAGPADVPVLTDGDDALSDGTLTDAGPTDDTLIGDGVLVGPDGGGTVTDSDGDGIPDDQDHIPCMGFYLTVYNTGVTSATIEVNGAEVVGSSSFPTSDAITVTLNPVSGTNTLALGGKLAGGPSDSLTLLVTDTNQVVYFSTVIVREPGRPDTRTYTFDVDVTCP